MNHSLLAMMLGGMLATPPSEDELRRIREEAERRRAFERELERQRAELRNNPHGNYALLTEEDRQRVLKAQERRERRAAKRLKSQERS